MAQYDYDLFTIGAGSGGAGSATWTRTIVGSTPCAASEPTSGVRMSITSR